MDQYPISIIKRLGYYGAMSLDHIKWIAAGVILLLSLAAGLASQRVAIRYQRFMRTGGAFANGVFIGVAVFHLYPNAIHGLKILQNPYPHLIAVSLIIISFFLIWALEAFAESRHFGKRSIINAWLLTVALSIHAFAAGLTLGLSETLTVVSVVFIAILAHKSFEMFALVVSLHKRLPNRVLVLLIYCCFAFVTPLGIILGTVGTETLSAHMDNFLTAFFSAFAAGTFLYIGLAHRHHHTKPITNDSHQAYNNLLWTLIGVAAMAVLSIWA